MPRLRSTAALELATQLQFVLARETFIEARLFITYTNPARLHHATLALYSEPSRENLYDNVFRGDVAEMKLDLNSLGHAQTNNRFINDLVRSLSPDWRYLSKRLSLGFDTEGFEDVSARFDIKDLKTILSIN